MQIEVEQWQHSGGTTDATCRLYKTDENNVQWHVKDLTVSSVNHSYLMGLSGSKLLGRECPLQIFLNDLVDNPKNLTDLDWQLLKITNPDVESYQWQIFKLLKDLLDNRTTEDYIVSKVKEVLEQYEI